ncbi:right-handed parallel beta-helix repeat-containing protein [Salinibacterium sp. SYSU T00001]|uniref:right-handed parallel beta-helix repeat-containing protein n=1 Tax=Homoserinimonas sedimenticola TaxID=2986805 RepID=UPI002236668A|nr:right-handed parallel beta-helix repeat-containing protein [Salinibacterium sedimenticola]MCW4384686.1 right-handed parallel beta-helix repeat-containing protein [Salinibacterium sedimenticola]
MSVTGTHRIDVRDYLQGNEVLHDDDSASVAHIIQRALDAANALYLAEGISCAVFLPAGRYRLDDSLVARSGAGLQGEARGATVLRPRGNRSAILATVSIHNTSLLNPIADVVYRNFSIDGSDQAFGSYQTSIKGIFIQHLVRATFSDVAIENTWATGFGVDFVQDTSFVSCVAKNCGRGITVTGTNRDTALGGSGFGIGTGASDIESVSITGCSAIGNGVHGIFTETQTSATTTTDTPLLSRGLRVIGNHVSGNWIGLKDAGSRDAIFEGNTVIQNEKAGFELSRTSLSSSAGVPAGHGGIFRGNQVAENGTGSGAGGGIVIGHASSGRYSIAGNRIQGNTGFGIRGFLTASTTNIGPHIEISDNTIVENSRAGVFFGHATSHPVIAHLLIRSNHICDNGTDATSAQRDGIRIDSSMAEPRILSNVIRANAGSGILLSGSSRSTADAVVWANDLASNGGGGYSVTHTKTGTWIEQNIGDF